MKEAKLIGLLKTLNSHEFKEFSYFVNSPYFTRNKKLREFFKIVEYNYPEFNNPNFTYQKIFSKIYPGKKYNEKSIKYLKTELYKVFKLYLITVESGKDEFTNLWNLLKQYGRRTLPLEFNKVTKEIEDSLQKNTIRNNDYYFKNYLLKKEIRNFYETKKPLGKRTIFFESIKDEIDEFIIYFVIKMLKYYAVLRTQENILNYSYNYKLQDELMEYTKENLLSKYPIAQLFYYLNLLFKDTDNENVYYELKELVNKYHGILENNDAELIYSGLFNYTKIKYLEGKDFYSAENTAIMKEMMTKRFYPREDNYMSENAFINYVSIALREKEYDWVENFIKDFKDQLSPEKKENICMYCLGILYYRKKEYNRALDYLAKVKTSDFFYYLRVNNHLLKIFYETGEMESVLTIIDSLKHSLANNKIIPDYVVERYSNYINYLQKLVKLHECKNPEKLEILAKNISAITEFENKAWLLEMIKKENNPVI